MIVTTIVTRPLVLYPAKIARWIISRFVRSSMDDSIISAVFVYGIGSWLDGVYFFVLFPEIMLVRELMALVKGPLAPWMMALVMKESAAANVGLAVVVENLVEIDDDDDDDDDESLPTKLPTMALRIGATSLSTLGWTWNDD